MAETVANPVETFEIEKSPSADINKAWNFFYTSTLPRRVTKNEGFRKLEVGEECSDATNYQVFQTPLIELGDFGIGIGLYFDTLVLLTVLFIILGIIMSPVINYFRSDEYSEGQETLNNLSLHGSAACTIPRFNNELRASYCNFDVIMAICDSVVTIVLIAFIFFLKRRQEKFASAIDAAEQTAQDYAVVASSIPADATDPDEWKDFFGQFGNVVYITIAKDNGPLLECLSRRRLIVEMLAREGCEIVGHIEPDWSFLEGQVVQPYQKAAQSIGLLRDVNYWRRMYEHENELLKQLMTVKYRAISVFCQFELEEQQANCLVNLSVGLIPAYLDTSLNMPEAYRFRKEEILFVEEPTEPTDLFWHFLHIDTVHQVLEQSATLAVSICIIIGVAFAIKHLSEASAQITGVFISVANALLPFAFKKLNATEEHHDSTSYQRSLLIKLVLCRWVTTAIVIYIITPNTEVLSEVGMEKIMSILWADAFTTPVLRCIDLPGLFKKYLLAPKAKTQGKMNSYFMGGDWFLAERYTDMTKTIFLSLFFSAILPQGLFVAAIAFFVCYWADKYCLLRLWKTPPAVDDRLAKSSLGHIVWCLMAHIFMAKLYFAGYPYTNRCETAGMGYQKCDQSTSGVIITSLDGSYMSVEQERTVIAYNVYGLILFIMILFGYLRTDLMQTIRKLFIGNYRNEREHSNTSFLTINEIQAYIPQMTCPVIEHPLLACSLDNVDKRHISWTGNFDKYNLCSEIDLPGTSSLDRCNLFSVCKYYGNDVAAAGLMAKDLAGQPGQNMMIVANGMNDENTSPTYSSSSAGSQSRSVVPINDDVEV